MIEQSITTVKLVCCPFCGTSLPASPSMHKAPCPYGSGTKQEQGWNENTPISARWSITQLDLATLEMILQTLRQQGRIEVRLVDGPQSVPSLAELALAAIAKHK